MSFSLARFFNKPKKQVPTVSGIVRLSDDLVRLIFSYLIDFEEHQPHKQHQAYTYKMLVLLASVSKVWAEFVLTQILGRNIITLNDQSLVFFHAVTGKLTLSDLNYLREVAEISVLTFSWNRTPNTSSYVIKHYRKNRLHHVHVYAYAFSIFFLEQQKRDAIQGHRAEINTLFRLTYSLVTELGDRELASAVAVITDVFRAEHRPLPELRPVAQTQSSCVIS